MKELLDGLESIIETDIDINYLMTLKRGLSTDKLNLTAINVGLKSVAKRHGFGVDRTLVGLESMEHDYSITFANESIGSMIYGLLDKMKRLVIYLYQKALVVFEYIVSDTFRNELELKDLEKVIAKKIGVSNPKNITMESTQLFMDFGYDGLFTVQKVKDTIHRHNSIGISKMNDIKLITTKVLERLFNLSRDTVARTADTIEIEELFHGLRDELISLFSDGTKVDRGIEDIVYRYGPFISGDYLDIGFDKKKKSKTMSIAVNNFVEKNKVKVLPIPVLKKDEMTFILQETLTLMAFNKKTKDNKTFVTGLQQKVIQDLDSLIQLLQNKSDKNSNQLIENNIDQLRKMIVSIYASIIILLQQLPTMNNKLAKEIIRYVEKSIDNY